MNEHFEQAADRAAEIAEKMCGDHGPERPWPGDRAIAAHLAYMAGLLRGAATREPNKNAIGYEIQVDNRVDPATAQKLGQHFAKMRRIGDTAPAAAIRSVLWNHYPKAEDVDATGSVRRLSCACTADLPSGWIPHVAHEVAKATEDTCDPAEQRYEELAKAACAAAGIVWPATHRGLLHALQGAADELKAWEDSWKTAEERAKTSKNLQKIAESEAEEANGHWQTAVAQRDELVRAARDHINGWCGRSREALAAAIKRADAPSNRVTR